MVCRSGKQGCDLSFLNSDIKSLVNFLDRKLFVREIFFKQFINAFSGNLDDHLSEILNLVSHILGEWSGLKTCSRCVKIFYLSCNNIDESADLFSLIERYLNGRYALSEMLAKLSQNSVIIGMLVVHKVHKEHSGRFKLLDILPCFFRSDFNSRLAGNYYYGRVGNLCGKHYLSGEIKITGSIYKIDLRIFPFHGKD